MASQPMKNPNGLSVIIALPRPGGDADRAAGPGSGGGVCPDCGAPCPDDAKFCPQCGMDLETAEEGGVPKYKRGTFNSLSRKLARQPRVKNPEALAAAIGRKKYGAAKFNQMAQRGR